MRQLKIFRYKVAKRLKAVLLTGNLHEILLGTCALLIPFFAFTGFSLVLYDFGFKPFWSNSETVDFWGQIVLNALSLLLGIRLLLRLVGFKKMWSPTFNLIGWLFILFLAVYVLPTKAELTSFTTNKFLILKLILYAGVILTFVTEASYLLQSIYSRSVSPAFLFVMSFAFLIVAGTFLLKLPNATTKGINLIDALFTATSAVCVTGLAVVDTATRFTTFGKVIIMILIQIGGLGIGEDEGATNMDNCLIKTNEREAYCLPRYFSIAADCSGSHEHHRVCLPRNIIG